MRAVVLLLLVAAASAKVFERCELARTLKAAQMGGTLSDWVCLVENESSYSTKKKNSRNRNGTTDYGLFQINNKWWCDDGKYKGVANGCGIFCSDLLSDDIQTAIRCAKLIASQQGMKAWVAWKNHCQGDTSRYIDGCGV